MARLDASAFSSLIRWARSIAYFADLIGRRWRGQQVEDALGKGLKLRRFAAKLLMDTDQPEGRCARVAQPLLGPAGEAALVALGDDPRVTPACVRAGWDICPSGIPVLLAVPAVGWDICPTLITVDGLVAHPERLGDGAVGDLRLQFLDPLGELLALVGRLA
jgi:hypothetical protein